MTKMVTLHFTLLPPTGTSAVCRYCCSWEQTLISLQGTRDYSQQLDILHDKDSHLILSEGLL